VSNVATELHLDECYEIRPTPFSCLLDLEKPAQKFGNFSSDVLMRTPIHLFYLENCQNRCRISGRKAAFASRQKKIQNTFWRLSMVPGGDFPHFCVSAHHGPSLIFQVSSISFRHGRVISEKPTRDPSK